MEAKDSLVKSEKLDITQTSDFHCLLELMLPLYQVEEYAWLPELFSIIGYEKLLTLAKYAGGETIKIPTIDEISNALEALDWYYKVYVIKKKYRKSIPGEYVDLVNKIKEVFDAANNS